jgi:hypothetical protein
MYLSSDNWTFSVFHPLTEELAAFTASDEAAFASLLTAGIRDVRLEVYAAGAFNAGYRGLEHAAFVAAIRQNSDWMRDDGVMPLFAYEAATQSSRMHAARVNNIEEEYAASLTRVSARLSPSARRRFADVAATFRSLYAARTAYDVYEYFGLYAFLRHATILKTSTALAALGADAAHFQYLASTYRFEEANQSLETHVNGGTR